VAEVVMAVPPIGARGGPWPPASTPANSADTRYVLQHILGSMCPRKICCGSSV